MPSKKSDQPYQKLLTYGAKKLADAELLAIVFKSGMKGKSALQLARELLNQHGNLSSLIHAPRAVLTKQLGIGDVKYLTLQAAIEIGKRYLRIKKISSRKINTIQKAQKFLALQLDGHCNEVFACLFLKHNLELITFDELFCGTINQTNVYPREIVRRSLQYNAAKIILAHNHPSGSAKPSIADQNATELIIKALSLIDVEVVDHIIIAQQSSFSFKKAGML